MRIFDFRDRLIADYASYVKSFIEIRDPRIREHVESLLAAGLLWPQPLIQLNPAFEAGRWIDDLVDEKLLHPTCARVFRRDKDRPETKGEGRRLRLHRHREESVRVARKGTRRLVRIRSPRSIVGEEGGAKALAQLSGSEEARSADAIRKYLLGGYRARHPETGDPAFAFRIRRFITRGDTVHASFDEEAAEETAPRDEGCRLRDRRPRLLGSPRPDHRPRHLRQIDLTQSLNVKSPARAGVCE